MKIKLSLILIGTLVGLLLANTVASFVLRGREGKEFKNIDEFRASLADPRASGSFRLANGSLPFAAVINPELNDRLIYTLKPNLNDNFTGVQVRTNSHGMRGPEVSLEKPPGIYRLAVLGDSFVFGWGVDEDKIFPKVIENHINRDQKGKLTVQVLNFGIPGYSTFQEVELFKERVAAFKPDGVLVFFVENDFDFPFFIRDESKPNGLVQSFSLIRLGARALPLPLQRQKEAMRGLEPNTTLAELSRITDTQRIQLFLSVNPHWNWPKVVSRLSVIRHNTGIHFINIAPDFKRLVVERNYKPSDLYLPKDPHPTALGHSLYGELLARGLAPLMTLQ